MDCSELRDDRIDVLYGEADADTVRRVTAHHALCEPCREEMSALRRLRRDLPSWELPATLEPRARAPRLAPRALAWAAAALIALAGSFVLSGSEARYEHGELAVRFGAPRSAPDGVEARLAALEAQHRQDIAALQARALAPASRDDAAILRSVDAMIHESERRQAGALDQRLVAFGERADAQRRYDLARVSAGLSYLEGKTGQDAARTTELMGYVLKASQQR